MTKIPLHQVNKPMRMFNHWYGYHWGSTLGMEIRILIPSGGLKSITGIIKGYLLGHIKQIVWMRSEFFSKGYERARG